MQTAAIYVTVQILGYGLDMGLFLLLHNIFSADIIFSNVIAKAAAGAFGFFSHRHITFSAKVKSSLWGQAARFTAILVANIFASSALLTLFLSFTSNPIAAKIPADTIMIAVNFLLAKFVIFPNNNNNREGSGF